jgi:multidrug resistance efflux pump
MKNFFASFGRALLTLVVVLVAVLAGWELWSYYMLEPWTRDGRVRADVVMVAADVSGLVSDVFVHDNEKVSKGQQLFRIDKRRFQYALEQAKADVASQQATLDQAKRDLARSKSLTRQQVERAQQATDEAQAKLDAANAAHFADCERRFRAMVSAHFANVCRPMHFGLSETMSVVA